MNLKDYEYKIRSSALPVVVDFWAPWCGPCKAMDPLLSQTKEEFAGKVNVIKINADANPEVMQKLGIYSIPTMIAYVNGSQVYRKAGVQPLNALENLFNQLAEGNHKISSPNLTTRDRVIRLMLGTGLLGAGFYFGKIWVLIGFGFVVIFSAFYDRCPIYKAVSAKILTLFKNKVEV
jgi:thioredoxin 1